VIACVALLYKKSCAIFLRVGVFINGQYNFHNATSLPAHKATQRDVARNKDASAGNPGRTTEYFGHYLVDNTAVAIKGKNISIKIFKVFLASIASNSSLCFFEIFLTLFSP
jgi:hypothetical protein